MNACHWITRHGLNRAVPACPAGGRGTESGSLAGKGWVPAVSLPMPRACDLALFLSSMVFWWQVRACEGVEGGGCGVPLRASTESVCTFWACAGPPPVARRAPQCYIHKKKQWCAGDRAGQRRWQVRAWSRGCARKQVHAIVRQCALLAFWARVRAPFPSPSPLPGVRLNHFLFETAPKTRTPTLLPPPLPLLPLCACQKGLGLPLLSSASPSVSPSASLSPTWC